MALIITDLESTPIEVDANTGTNNGHGRKIATLGSSVYISGEYDSYLHAFLGTYKLQFGGAACEFARNLDIFVASLIGSDVPPVVIQAEVSLTKQGNSFILSWRATIIGAVAQTSTSLTSNSWSDLGTAPALIGDVWQITLASVLSGNSSSVFC